LIASPNVIDPLVAMVVHSLGYACWNSQRKSCAPILQICDYRYCGKRLNVRVGRRDSAMGSTDFCGRQTVTARDFQQTEVTTARRFPRGE